MTAKAKAGGTIGALEDKWGESLIKSGWTALPNVVFERAVALGLDALDIAIILHLASTWWSKDSKAQQAKSTIAKALGVEPRTIQRRIAAMEIAGFIKREQRRLPDNNSKPNIYHLDGLIAHAEPLAREKLERRASEAAEREKSVIRKKARFSAPSPEVAA